MGKPVLFVEIKGSVHVIYNAWSRKLLFRETIKSISFQNYKNGYQINTWSDKACKGTIVKRAFTFLQGK